MFEWTNKIDNVDDILADDINSIAQEVIILQKNINDIDDECDAKIGALDNLETNDKSNLVNAINEIVASGSSSGIIVDQTYNSTSANAQSGIAVAEAVAAVEFKIGDMDNLYYPASEPEHRNLVMAFNWLHEYHNSDIQTLYRDKADTVVLNEINTNLDAKITVNSQAITALQQNMGDIDTALDNIIDLQNSYIGGDSV